MTKTQTSLFAAGALTLLALAPAAQATPLVLDDEAEAEEKEAEPKDEYLAVVGGDVYTGTGEVLRGATLLAKNGKIEAIGYDVEIPGLDYDRTVPLEERDYETRLLDASGLRVYPGLVAISSSGLLGTSGDFRDSIDPFSQNMILALASGITTTGQSSSAVKLKRYVDYLPPLEPEDADEVEDGEKDDDKKDDDKKDKDAEEAEQAEEAPKDFPPTGPLTDYDFDGVVVQDKAYVSLSWGSGSAKRSLREKLSAAAAYLRAYAQWQIDVKADKELKEPSKKGVDPSTLALLRGEVYGKFRADAREDLLGIARIAQEYGFRPVIDGCREGWTVADELGRAGAMAIVTPRERRDKDERLVRPGGTSIENAAILHAAGVSVAIVPSGSGINLGGIVGRDIMHLPVEVGFAIRGGLPEDAAIASMTTIPARMMRIGHRVGSLEVGKDCDLILTDGDILHYQTFVQYTVVDGDLVYDKRKELYFAHIRPREDEELPPYRIVDAGENEEEEAPAEGEGEKPDEDKENGEDEDKKKDNGEGEGEGEKKPDDDK